MGYIGSDPVRNDSVSTAQLADDAVTNPKIVDDITFSNVTASNHISASGTGSFGSVYTTGNVGIGTTTPDYTLDVAGDAGFNEYIYHNGDANTYIQFSTDQIDFVAGAANMIYMNEGGGGAQADKVTINNDAADVDFHVKGDNDTNLIRTDAANDRVGIGTPSGSEKLTVVGDVGVSGSASSSLKVNTAA